MKITTKKRQSNLCPIYVHTCIQTCMFFLKSAGIFNDRVGTKKEKLKFRMSLTISENLLLCIYPSHGGGRWGNFGVSFF